MVAPNISELVTHTLRERSGKLADLVTNNNALLYKLKERGRSRPYSGGRTIMEELAYQENQTFKWYSGYETLDVRPTEIMTAAEYNIKQAAIAVSMSGLEMIQNSGKEAVLDLMEERISNAERTFMNQMSTAIYSDGTANSGKQLGGLQHLVADTGLGTVGGINSSTWGFWQNYVYDFSSNGYTVGPSNIQRGMEKAWVNQVRNGERSNLIVADNTMYLHYLNSLQPQQRFSDAKTAQAGFENLKFMSLEVILDGGQDGAAPDTHMYMLDMDYLKFRPHRQRNISMLGGRRQPLAQDAYVQFMVFAGNMTTSNRSRQAVLVA